MAIAPSGALPGAAVAAIGLAALVLDLAGRLPGDPQVTEDATRDCRRIAAILAPRATRRAAVAEIARSLVGSVQALARAADPGTAAPLLYAAAAQAGATCPASASPVLKREYRYARALAAAIEAAALGEAFLCEARAAYPDRVAALAARARIGAAADASFDRIAELLGIAVAEIMAAAAREAAGHLVQTAATLRSVVRVEAGRSFPATYAAWHLYRDPSRAEELLARAASGTPLFLPATYEALAPDR
ncbi:hypothetical protein [Methylobacterium frigidaeris]|uniref:Uncharacterized protein n=1 Tax=Methylobacterium frigidaeris TaxID=2038277 RepID=A0AA37HG09_9HYPH|nr:hypothetical protein [Methylobacterium frigidaeris]PIK74814.1 hypothetical protein CS379_00510 [Methylobacterium frigidaeris]GJD65178.1 hypothetical protein MPEAHAMD_5365 [Methylobacterium frigidaeris]